MVGDTPRERARRREITRLQLEQIANALGCDVEELTKLPETEPESPSEAAELVRLWFKMRNPVHRQAILSQMRKYAAMSPSELLDHFKPD